MILQAEKTKTSTFLVIQPLTWTGLSERIPDFRVVFHISFIYFLPPEKPENRCEQEIDKARKPENRAGRCEGIRKEKVTYLSGERPK